MYIYIFLLQSTLQYLIVLESTLNVKLVLETSNNAKLGRYLRKLTDFTVIPELPTN